MGLLPGRGEQADGEPWPSTAASSRSRAGTPQGPRPLPSSGFPFTSQVPKNFACANMWAMAWISEPNVYGVTAIEYRNRGEPLDFHLVETSAWGRRLQASVAPVEECDYAHDA